MNYEKETTTANAKRTLASKAANFLWVVEAKRAATTTRGGAAATRTTSAAA